MRGERGLLCKRAASTGASELGEGVIMEDEVLLPLSGLHLSIKDVGVGG
jgi:hypothetical protein